MNKHTKKSMYAVRWGLGPYEIFFSPPQFFNNGLSFKNKKACLINLIHNTFDLFKLFNILLILAIIIMPQDVFI